MASAYLRKKRNGDPNWYISFRCINQTGSDRVRRQAPTEYQSRAMAETLARDLDAACRRYEQGIQLDATIAYLEQFPWREFQGLRDTAMSKYNAPRRKNQVSLKDAALSHPAVQREQRKWPKQFKYHMRALETFSEAKKVYQLKDLTLQAVLSWIETLRAGGSNFNSRSHQLLYVRFASRMASSYGLHNVLAGHILDHDDEIRQIRIISLSQAITLLWVARHDPRMFVCLGVLAFAGLRPSEVIRLKARDWTGKYLMVGARERKNASSRRDIPLPAFLAEYLDILNMTKQPEDAMFDQPVLSGKHLQRADRLSIYTNPFTKSVLGAHLPPKMLRKFFFTWARRDLRLDPDVLESYIGHRIMSMRQVSERHYFEGMFVEQFQPIADAVDVAVTREFDTLSTRGLQRTEDTRLTSA